MIYSWISLFSLEIHLVVRITSFSLTVKKAVTHYEGESQQNCEISHTADKSVQKQMVKAKRTRIQ